MNTLTCGSEEEAAAEASKVKLVLAATFARFLGLGAVANGDGSRHLFARVFFSTSNRYVSTIVFLTVAAFLSFLSQERQTCWGSVLSLGRTSPWSCCTKSKISRLASLNEFLQYLESPIDPQSRQEERSIPPTTGYNFFGVAIFSPLLSDFGFAFERALCNHTFIITKHLVISTIRNHS